MRRTMLLVTAMAAALVLCSTAAFAAIKMGTDAGETLTGTRGVDEIIGLGGNDLLRGLARSDVYRFDDGFGEDKLEEKKKYGKRGGGSDLVDFSEVSDSEMVIGLVPEFVGKGDCALFGCFGVEAYDPGYMGLRPPSDKVDFTNTAPERATGGAYKNFILAGKEKNVLGGSPGYDVTLDFGGISAENSLGFPALAASDDIFVAGEGDSATLQLTDFGGSADTLDLRAMGNFEEVDISAHPDRGELGGTSLVFTKPDGGSVLVEGGVTPAYKGQKNGVMERVLFADGARSAAEVLAKAEGPAEAQEVSSGASSSSAKDQQQLSERAKKLLEDAQAALPLLGNNAAAGK